MLKLSRLKTQDSQDRKIYIDLKTDRVLFLDSMDLKRSHPPIKLTIGNPMCWCTNRQIAYNCSMILNLDMLAISEIPILNSLIFQISFTVVFSGLFLWQAFKALNEVKQK